MFLYLKSSKFVYVLAFFYLSSCVRTVDNPVKKYNSEFLRNNSNKISRSKNKHLSLAREQGIYYRVSEADAIDSNYYKGANGSKLKKNYRNNNKMNEEEKQKEIKYLDDNLSIYYKHRSLKDDSDMIKLDKDHKEFLMYLAENYPDYSKERINFGDIEPSSEILYGDLTLRKDKDYKYIDNQTMQENFDYIDIMSRVKKQLYLEGKKREIKNNEGKKKDAEGAIQSIKNKFMGLFK